MLRETLIETATKLGIENQLRELRMSLPTNRRFRMHEHNLRLLMTFILREDSNCIDIGVYRGRVIEEMIRLAPRGKHIAYEPQPERYEELITRFPSVDFRKVALSNEEGETTFNNVKNMPGYSGMREISYPRRPQIEKFTVRMEKLDNSLPEGYVPTLIKIDVEGAERLVLEGGIKTITAHKPTIIFEHGKAGANYYDTKPRDMYDLLVGQVGLRIFDLDGNGPYTLQQFEQSCAEDKRWDYVAIR